MADVIQYTVAVAQPLFDAIDKGMAGTIAQGSARVMLALGGLYGTFWLIRLTVKAMFWIWRGMDQAVEELVREIIKMAAIVGCAFNIPWYTSTVVPFVSNAPTAIAQMFSGATGPATNMVDTLISGYASTIIHIINNMSFSLTSMDTVAAGTVVLAILLIAGLAFLGITVATLVVLKISTVLLLAIGPMFIAFALFDTTRQWFLNWVNTLAGFMLTQVLFGLVVTLEIDYINANIIGNDGILQWDWVAVLALPLILGSFTMLAQAIPGYASALMGGGGGSMGMLSGMNPIGSAARMAMRMKFGGAGGKGSIGRG